MTHPVTHPVTRLLEWFAELDFAVLEHGFAPHGRDYAFVVESPFGERPGRYRLTFTHVVAIEFVTAVRDDVWPESWDDVFTNYAAWEKADAPVGYVWGTNWSNAYPGLSAVEPSPRAAEWSRRIGRPMFEAALETDRFRMTCCFHELRADFLDGRTDLVSQVVIPVD